jgi:acetyl-CoA/propionyl-CoA carboxylase biotin carboxyl carrier protein
MDTGVASGDQVPAQFDSLMAKLIVVGPDRESALRRARVALKEFRIEGLPTVLPFHRAVIEEPDFTDSPFRVDTTWIEREFTARLETAEQADPLPAAERRRFTIEIDGRAVMLGLPSELLAVGGDVSAQGATGTSGTTLPDGAVTAPVAGTLAAWRVSDGDTVASGDPIAAIEAMKMETLVRAPQDGVVHLADLTEGDAVERGQELARLE